jgi:hypothetical protein
MLFTAAQGLGCYYRARRPEQRRDRACTTHSVKSIARTKKQGRTHKPSRTRDRREPRRARDRRMPQPHATTRAEADDPSRNHSANEDLTAQKYLPLEVEGARTQKWLVVLNRDVEFGVHFGYRAAAVGDVTQLGTRAGYTLANGCRWADGSQVLTQC